MDTPQPDLRHCDVHASPARTEAMAPEVVERCLEVLARHPEIRTLDLTGGAPRAPSALFDSLVERASALGKRAIVRHSLTAQAEGHPHTSRRAHLPEFFARHRVEVVSSLP